MTIQDFNAETAEYKVYDFIQANCLPTGKIPPRAQIAAATGISRPTISNCVRNLALAGQLRVVNGAYFLVSISQEHQPGESAQQLTLEGAEPVEIVRTGSETVPDSLAECQVVIAHLRAANAGHMAENERLRAELRLLRVNRPNGELQRDLQHEQARARDLGRDLGRALAAVRYWQTKAHVAEHKAGLPLTPLAGMALFVDQPAATTEQ